MGISTTIKTSSLKPIITKFVKKAVRPRDKNFRNHVYIFFICCGISLFIWFLIKMSDDYVAGIGMRIEYTNPPADKVMTRADNIVIIRMRANGGDLFSAKYISARKKLEVNISQADIRKGRYFDRYYLLTSQLRNQLSQRFDFAHDIISLSPDTLFLNFEEIITRAIPVKPGLTLNCKPQFQVYDSLVIIPPEIMVSGPANIIDTLTSIRTQARTLNDLDGNTEVTLPLLLPLESKKINYSAEKVKAIVSVEAFTESVITLPVSSTSNDSGTRIRTFPEQVEVVYQVAIKDFKLVKPEMFTLTVTYDPEKDKNRNLLKVKVDKAPDFVRINRITPDRVEYIIQK
jgi:hypothetical protein